MTNTQCPIGLEELLVRFRQGDRRACARIMTVVEDEGEEALRALDELYRDQGRAWRIGITGPPGAGKSTLVERLAREFRQRDMLVGVVAVDPTSPFSGGAILGDRVRMPSLFTDPGVFIRSMASRGGLGGLARRTREVCDVLDAFGRDVIIIETVGVGQIELDVASAAHTTVVVLVPESGDSIQVMKAGLMEIGELFCINKADRQGAERLLVEVQSMLNLRGRNRQDRQGGAEGILHGRQADGRNRQDRQGGAEGILHGRQADGRNRQDRQGESFSPAEAKAGRTNGKVEGWEPPVVETVATTGSGIPELVERLEAHRAFFVGSGLEAEHRRQRVRNEVVTLVEDQLRQDIWSRPGASERLAQEVEAVLTGAGTPYSAADRLLRTGFKGSRVVVREKNSGVVASDSTSNQGFR